MTREPFICRGLDRGFAFATADVAANGRDWHLFQRDLQRALAGNAVWNATLTLDSANAMRSRTPAA